MSEQIFEKCDLCEDTSSYDTDSIETAKYIINGIEHIICCPCLDSITRIVRDEKLIECLEEREAEDGE